MMALHWVGAGVKVLWGQVHRVGEAGDWTGLLGVVVVHLLHLDSVVLCLRPQVCPGNREGRSNIIRARRSEVFGAPEWAGETGSTESKEAANVEDEGSLVLGPGGDEDGLVRTHVRDVPGVPSPCSGTYNG